MDTKANDADEKESPLIEQLEWGSIHVKGFSPGKDFKLFPGGALEWDWNETNTRHVPGIQQKDVEFLIEKGAKYIVLSRGMKNKLETPKETEDFLEKQKANLDINDYFIKTTLEAHKLYNQLVLEKKPVGALIHSTC
ncbi:unnamed protein product [Rotaria magnacalcarata]|uniref:Uncharacterized protein n=1 Tax=Rotaria magnacalcarata TaxID=392030 RepID=A0A816UEE1_9BILA|nr:unnamed protein product [Rotaria magnacalcarata]CAF1625221.1 unnamed protein product [Rotaria magnacalcarata]CAF2068200.1 unnamed protein product [Rotaria magnacalcarata]CAF2109387.1 unnamed protein product [Rotaria magnacalcarata]CAF2132627.1 unnamed protein product [Rotaria magnacalcarata]